MIACRTCTEEEVDPELKQLCGKMEEVCEKNNIDLCLSAMLEEVRKPQRENTVVRR